MLIPDEDAQLFSARLFVAHARSWAQEALYGSTHSPSSLHFLKTLWKPTHWQFPTRSQRMLLCVGSRVQPLRILADGSSWCWESILPPRGGPQPETSPDSESQVSCSDSTADGSGELRPNPPRHLRKIVAFPQPTPSKQKHSAPKCPTPNPKLFSKGQELQPCRLSEQRKVDSKSPEFWFGCI